MGDLTAPNPALARKLWESMRDPSSRRVATKMRQTGVRISHQTINRWRRNQWRPLEREQHPLDQARAALESALPLMTGDPTSTIDDLLRGSPEGEELGEFSDSELLRKAARELARAVYLVAHMMLLQGAEKLWITRTAAVAVLMRALADSMRSVTVAFGQVLTMRSAKPAVAKTDLAQSGQSGGV
jgi:hypothetical protein